ncbi:MAG TPA: translocation/assembly module TamB domain-containing protein [Oligoflexia bacterium]|nr:translocation/assembly module TamB domain-containing protein [Oligoflexia bacterium]HMR24657.1 translocation/assembly module TamB domain-containing protein [Oligoflexia bacterium]
MKKLSKIILYGVVVFFVFFITVVSVVWFFPKTVINKPVLSWLYQQQKFIKFEGGFPESLYVDASNTGLMTKKFKIKVSDSCVTTANKVIEGCVDLVDLETEVDFSGFSLKLKSLGPIFLHTKGLKFQVQANTKQKSETPFIVEDFLSENFYMNDLDIDLANTTIVNGTSQYTSDLKIIGKTVDSNYTLDCFSKLNYEESKNLILTLKAKVNDLRNIVGNLELKNQVNNKLNAHLKGDLSLNVYELKGTFLGSGYANGLSSTIEKVRFQKIEFDNSDAFYLSLDFSSQLLLESYYTIEASGLPKPEIKTNFSGKAEARENQAGIIDYRVEIQPIKQYGTIINANTKGAYKKSNQTIMIKELLFQADIPYFENLVKKLKRTQWGIPAPFNTFKGNINLSLGKKGQIGTLDQKKFSIPINIKTNLKSSHQAFKTQSSGEIVYDSQTKKVNVDLDVGLNNIKLAIPNFDPASKLPKITSDQRILVQNKKNQSSQSSEALEKNKIEKKKNSVFSYAIKINTPDKPIQIIYDLFKPSAKLRLKGNVSNESSVFTVKAEPFKVEYLKREAKLEKFIVKTNSKKDSIYLDGKFLIKKADYDLYVNVEQRYETPRIMLSSNPPLPEEDIISLILFNQLSNDINSGSSNSVQNTRAAIAQKTIGFFSFFVLSSTPVESVNYDPNTKTYSARVKLPGGFTGTVGSDWDEAQEVGIRRSLGGNWAISAGVGTDTQGEQKQESMLEWFYRY